MRRATLQPLHKVLPPLPSLFYFFFFFLIVLAMYHPQSDATRSHKAYPTVDEQRVRKAERGKDIARAGGRPCQEDGKSMMLSFTSTDGYQSEGEGEGKKGRMRGEREGGREGRNKAEDNQAPQRGHWLPMGSRTSSLLPAAVDLLDVLQAQQAQLAEGGAASLGGVKAE